jgi:mono/diheme cytochrome c family protein
MLKAKGVLFVGGIAVLVAIGLLWLTGTLSSQRETPVVSPSTGKLAPPEFAMGETLFNTHCSICHGP